MSTFQESKRTDVALGYVGRVLVFHCLWIALLLFFDFLGHVVAPTESFVASWYVAYAPIGYALFLVAFAPISLGIACVIWLVRARAGHLRIAAVVVTLATWALAVGFALLAGVHLEPTLPEGALTAAAWICFGLLVPLPRGKGLRVETTVT